MTVIRSQCKDDAEYREALRDDFAAHETSRPDKDWWRGYFGYPEPASAEERIRGLVAYRFECADAMLAERDKPWTECAGG